MTDRELELLMAKRDGYREGTKRVWDNVGTSYTEADLDRVVNERYPLPKEAKTVTYGNCVYRLDEQDRLVFRAISCPPGPWEKGSLIETREHLAALAPLLQEGPTP